MSLRIPPNLKADCRIYFLHIRYEDEHDPLKFSTHGGVTVAYHYLKDLKQWEVAVATCNLSDNFCKKIGRTIASNRLNWGDCYRLDLEHDDTHLKEATDTVREWANQKLNLEYVNPDEGKIGVTSNSIH
jgi:hypothetical protein